MYRKSSIFSHHVVLDDLGIGTGALPPHHMLLHQRFKLRCDLENGCAEVNISIESEVSYFLSIRTVFLHASTFIVTGTFIDINTSVTETESIKSSFPTD